MVIHNRVINLNEAKALLHLMYEYARVTKGEQVRPLSILKRIQTHEAIVIASYVDGIPLAYIMIEPDKEAAFIQQVYSKDRKCTDSIWNYACKWAEKEGFERVKAVTYRRPKGFEKWGLKVEGYLIGKELSNGRRIKEREQE